MHKTPDWKSELNYDYTRSLEADAWAWEFLRRNPSYQSDFQEWCAVRAAVESVHGKLSKLTRAKRLSLPELTRYTPPKRDGEGDQEWYMRCVVEHRDPLKFALDVALARKWGLYELHDPAFSRPTRLKFLPRSDVYVTEHLDRLIEKLEFPNSSGENAVEKSHASHGRVNAFALFDLTHDLIPQLAFAKRELIRLREGKKDEEAFSVKFSKPQREKWVCYLRVLDAKQSQEDWKIIGRTLFPKIDDSYPECKAQRKARNTFRAATRIANTEYRTFIS